MRLRLSGIRFLNEGYAVVLSVLYFSLKDLMHHLKFFKDTSVLLYHNTVLNLYTHAIFQIIIKTLFLHLYADFRTNKEPFISR